MRKLGTAARRSLTRAADNYKATLGQPTQTYLTSRGFRPEDWERFSLGEVVDPEPGHEHLTGRLCIPYYTTSGVVDLKFRCIKHDNCKSVDCVKYLGLDGLGQDEGGIPKAWLYNAMATLDAESLVAIAEGELDAVAVECMANIPAVGVPGGTLWSKCKHWRRVFDGLRALVIADGDKAGLVSAKAIAASLPDAQVVRMPDGYDANSFLAEFGAEAFYERCGL